MLTCRSYKLSEGHHEGQPWDSGPGRPPELPHSNTNMECSLHVTKERWEDPICQMQSREVLRECEVQDHHVGKESHDRPQRNEGRASLLFLERYKAV